MDTASPYEASYDINASGLYEVYAVASDDDGNDITSTVQRIKVNEAEDTEDILTVSSDSTVTREVLLRSPPLLSLPEVSDTPMRMLMFMLMVSMRALPTNFLTLHRRRTGRPGPTVRLFVSGKFPRRSRD